jgi:hypothetical protein
MGSELPVPKPVCIQDAECGVKTAADSRYSIRVAGTIGGPIMCTETMLPEPSDFDYERQSAALKPRYLWVWSKILTRRSRNQKVVHYSRNACDHKSPLIHACF